MQIIPIIQVASCGQALIKTNRKPVQNHQSETMLLFKTYTLDFELDRHLEHMVIVIREFRRDSRVFFLFLFFFVNLAFSRFSCKMTVLQSLIFHSSPTGNVKNRSYLDRI